MPTNDTERRIGLRRPQALGAAPTPAPRSDFSKSLRRGGLLTEAALRDAAAAGAAMVGAEDYANKQLRSTQDLYREADTLTPVVNESTDVQDLSTAGQYVGNTLAGQAANIAAVALPGGLGRIAGRAIKGVQGARAGAAAGTVAGGTALETGSIFRDIAEDQESPLTLQQKAATSLAGGTAAGGLEALPVFRVFDKFGVGKAGRRAIERNLVNRVGREAAKGAVAESATEGAQTVIERAAHKFANENFEVFGDEGLHEIREAMIAGGVVGGSLSGIGGIPQGNRIEERIKDLEADDELSQRRAEVRAAKLRQQAPELGPEIDQLDFGFPDSRAKLDELEVNFSRNVDGGVRNTARLAAGHYKHPIESIDAFDENESALLEQILDDTANDNAEGLHYTRPEVQAWLSENFDDPAQLLDKIGKGYGFETRFELDEILGKLEAGELDVDDTVTKRVHKLVDDGQEADALIAAVTSGQGSGIDSIDEANQTPMAGEAGPEFYSTSEQALGAKYHTNTKGLPWKSKVAAERDSGKTFEGDDAAIKEARRRNEAFFRKDLERLHQDTGRFEVLEANKGDHVESEYYVDGQRIDLASAQNFEEMGGVEFTPIEKRPDPREYRTRMTPEEWDEFLRDHQRFEVVSYRQAAEEQGLNLEEAAGELLNSLSSEEQAKALERSAGDIVSILDDYNVVRETETPSALSERGDIALTPEELKPRTPPELQPILNIINENLERLNAANVREVQANLYEQVQQLRGMSAPEAMQELDALQDQLDHLDADARQGNALKQRKEEIKDLINSKKRPILKGKMKPKKDGSWVRGRFPVMVDGKEDSVDAMNLVMAMMRKLPYEESQDFVDRVAEAFAAGVSSLLEMREHDIRLTKEGIRDDVIVFTRAADKGGQSFTFEEISRTGAARTKTMLRNLRRKYVVEEDNEKRERVAQVGKEVADQDAKLREDERQNAKRKWLTSKEDASGQVDRREIEQEVTGRGDTETAPDGTFSAKPTLQGKVNALRERRDRINKVLDELAGMRSDAKVKAKKLVRGALEISDKRLATLNTVRELEQFLTEQVAAIPAQIRKANEQESIQRLEDEGIDERGLTDTRNARGKKRAGSQRVKLAKQTDETIHVKRVRKAATALSDAERARNAKITEQAKALKAERKARQQSVDDASRKSVDNVSLGGRTRRTMEQMRAAESTKERSRLQGLVRGWADSLGLPVKIDMLSVDEVLEAVRQRGYGEEYLVRGTGNAILVYDRKTKSFQVFVNPLLSKNAQIEALGHELGHVVFKTVAQGMPTAQKNQIFAEFENWRSQFGRSATMTDVERSKKTVAVLEELMGQRVIDRKLADLSDKDRDYLLDFEEWFADNVSRWLVTDAKPVGVVQEFFSHIADLIRDLFRLMHKNKPNAEVAKFLDSLFEAPIEHIELESAGVAFSRNVDGVDWDQVPKDALDQIKEYLEQTLGVKKAIRRRDLGDGKQAKYDAERKIMFISHVANEDGFRQVMNQAMRAAFDLVLNPDEQAILGRAFSSGPTYQQLRELLGSDLQALEEISKDPEAAAAYGYQLWAAGELRLGPQTQTVFQKIVDMITRVLGIVREHKQAEQILDAFQDGLLRQRKVRRERVRSGDVSTTLPSTEVDFVVQKVVREARLAKVREAADKVSGYIAPWLQAAGYDADARMRATKNPWLIKLLEQVRARVGTQGVGEGMLEARQRRRGQYEEKLHAIYDGQDRAFGERMAHLLNSGAEPTTPAERKAMRETYALLQEMWKYARAAGIRLGVRSPSDFEEGLRRYYPRVYDAEYLLDHREEFIQMLLQDKYKEHVTDKDMAARIWQALVDHGGDAESAGDTLEQKIREGDDKKKGATNPFMAAKNERTLHWLEDGDIGPFLSKDMGLTLSTYITQITKRAEYTRRFGKNVRGAMTVGDYLHRAAKAGASPEDLKTAEKFMEAVMGTLGSDINPKFQKLQGALMVWQNVSVLAMSTITSLVDPVGIAVRGDLATAWKSFGAGLKEIKAKIAGDKTELRKLAELMGTIERTTAQEALGYEFGGYYVTGRARRINEWFFRAIQLERWTRSTRLMALAGAKAFLEKHADGTYNRHSKRFLDQLDLRVGDVLLEEGKLKVLTSEERIAAPAKERRRDDRVRAALNRWVNESILRPDAVQRPIWASDPHWMLVFHLKSFTYSFNDRILKRVVSEVGEGNYAPLMYLGGYVPVMMAANVLRDGIQGMFDDDDEEWDFQREAIRAVQQSGVLGLSQFGFDMARNIQYGGTGIEELAGPTAGHAIQIMQALARGDEAKVNAVVRGLPAQNVWKKWDF